MTQCVCSSVKVLFLFEQRKIVCIICKTIWLDYENALNMILHGTSVVQQRIFTTTHKKLHRYRDHDFSSPTNGSVEKSKQVLKERFLVTNQAPDSQVLFQSINCNSPINLLFCRCNQALSLSVTAFDRSGRKIVVFDIAKKLPTLTINKG